MSNLRAGIWVLPYQISQLERCIPFTIKGVLRHTLSGEIPNHNVLRQGFSLTDKGFILGDNLGPTGLVIRVSFRGPGR